MSAWLGALLVFIAVASATVALVLAVESVRLWRRRSDVRRRVDALVDAADPAEANRKQLFRDSDDRGPSVYEALVSRFPRFADLPLLLEHSGLGWSVNTFLMLTAGGVLAGLLAGLVASGSLIVAAPLALLIGWVPYLVVRSRAAKRLDRFEEVFPEAIDMLGRAIRAGHPLSAGIQMVGQEVQEPVAAEFRRLFEEQRFGVPFTDALLGMVDRVDLVDVRIFTTAVIVQREVGGNLAEILDNIAAMIRARFRIRRQLRTYTAQGRLTGLVIGLMPFAVVGAIFVIDRDYITTLFDHPVGRFMVAAAIVMQIVGYFWVRRIVNIEI
jgi:tight adherence protein B